MVIKKIFTSMIAVIGFLTLAGQAVADHRWTVMEPIGEYQIVVVHEDHWLDQDIYGEIIPHVCERQSNHCKVLYWKDESLVPTSFPMRHEKSSGIVAYNVWDYRGEEYFGEKGWSCEIVDDPEVCFDLY